MGGQDSPWQAAGDGEIVLLRMRAISGGSGMAECRSFEQTLAVLAKASSRPP
jgi:hypothetical protein